MAPARKLTDEHIREIRQRHRKGERLVDLAAVFCVNRKTLTRRIAAEERAEADRAAALAEKRIRRQVARERRKLASRHAPAPASAAAHVVRRNSRSQPSTRMRGDDPNSRWLDTPKNLAARARAEATGLIRVRSPDGSLEVWVELERVDQLLESGWTLS
jgi:hypothetical protein